MDPGPLNIEVTAGCDMPEYQIRCLDSDGAVFPLAGWKAHAHVRKNPKGSLVYNLSPTIDSNDVQGLVTIPAIGYANTATIQSGAYHWDLILETPTGQRLDPTLAGVFSVTLPNTQPAT